MLHAWSLFAALLILGITYVLLTLRNLPGLPGTRHRPWVALAGGLAMLASGSLTLPGALAALNLPILGLLFGMLALAAALEVCGFFDGLSRRVVERATTQPRLLASVMVATAVLSALFLNDAVVLIFTPVLVKAARLLRVDAMPYLAGEAFAANIGSVATEVGNPQNAFIALRSGISFADYTLGLLPLTVLALVAGIALCLLLFRRSLSAPLDKTNLAELHESGIVEPRLLRAALALVVLVFIGFLAAPSLGLTIAHVAFGAGVAVLGLAVLLAPARLRDLARGIDLTILVFFVGLFWVIAGFREQGWSDELAHLFLGAAAGGAPSLLSLTAWSAVLSNLVSNVPAVILISPTLEPLHSQALWLALAASSTLAGNATLLGAAANVIVAETARQHGGTFDVKRFMLAGVPLTVVTLAVMLVLLGR